MISPECWHDCMRRFFDADNRTPAAEHVSVGRMKELYYGKDKPLPYDRLSFFGTKAELLQFLKNVQLAA